MAATIIPVLTAVAVLTWFGKVATAIEFGTPDSALPMAYETVK